MGKQIDNELSELLEEFNRIRKPLLNLLTEHRIDYIIIPDGDAMGLELYDELITSGEYRRIEEDAYKRIQQRTEQKQEQYFIAMYRKADRSKKKKVQKILRG